mgnify:CR=1 FL=1
MTSQAAFRITMSPGQMVELPGNSCIASRNMIDPSAIDP